MDEQDFFSLQSPNTFGVEYTRKQLLTPRQASISIQKNLNKIVVVQDRPLTPTKPPEKDHSTKVKINPSPNIAKMLSNRLNAKNNQITQNCNNNNNNNNNTRQFNLTDNKIVFNNTNSNTIKNNNELISPHLPLDNANTTNYYHINTTNTTNCNNNNNINMNNSINVNLYNDTCFNTTDNFHKRLKVTGLPTNEQSMMTQNSIQQTLTFDNALVYLKEANSMNNNSNKTTFIHITPRYNIDSTIVYKNFYDMVILEKPGYPNSGYIWTRSGVNYHNNILKNHQIMQLSLNGILVLELNDDYNNNNNNNNNNNSTLISIEQFLYERNIYNELKKRKWFKTFKEQKYFFSWKQLYRSKKFQLSTNKLLLYSIFSHEVYLYIVIYIFYDL